jgi:acetyl-CoA C-acetyltransferase
MAWEKLSESNAMWALRIPCRSPSRWVPVAGGYFAPHVRAYIRRSGRTTHIGAMVAVKDRRNGAKNPLAHLHQPDITLDKVMSSRCCGTRSATTRPAVLGRRRGDGDRQ